MKKYFLILLLLLASGSFLLASGSAFAQATSSAKTTVQAKVGKYYISLYGFVSPFASIVMSTDSFFLDSTVADKKGYFSFIDILVNEGFSHFCLQAIDIKRIGESYTCFNISPVRASIEKGNIFLPPTVGLSGRSIRPGSSIFASGYTMPGARVNLQIGNGIFIVTTADGSSFYKVEIKNIPVGKYQLFATANYEKKDSEKPSKTLEITSLSWFDIIKQNLLLILIIILLVLMGIILLIILISKRVRERIKKFLYDKGILKKSSKKIKLHHEWFIGF